MSTHSTIPSTMPMSTTIPSTISSTTSSTIIDAERQKCENNVRLKRENGLKNIPLTRLSLISPYPQYTYSQLEMRRKIEVLKYNNKSQISRNQKLSTLLKGNVTNASSVFAQTKCTNDEFLPTLSSSCDIPGKVFILQLNPNIPLYNHKNDKIFNF